MSFASTGYVDRVLGALQRVRPKSGGGWTAACAAHDDHNNSLSIDVHEDRILLKCFAGCDAPAIVGAIGLQVSDLFAPKDRSTSKPNNNGKVTVELLAAAKGLPVDFLTARGVKDFVGGVVIPYHNPDGSETSRARIRTALRAKDGSKWKTGSDELVPLGLNDLDDARQLHVICIAEGETDYWTLRQAGFPALGIPSAEMVKVLKPSHLQQIQRVYVMLDTDPAGEKFYTNLRDIIASFGIGADVYPARMPADCKDVNDLYRRDPAGFKATLTAMLKQARASQVLGAQADTASTSASGPAVPPQGVQSSPSISEGERVIVPDSELPASGDEGSGAAREGKKESAATTLVRLVQESNAELFHTPSKDSYVSIPVDGHLETYALKSRAVKDWLARLFWEHVGRTPNANAIQDARQTLGGLAIFDGQEHDVFLRVARGPQAIYVDLGDETWSAVEITADGWAVVPRPPVRFRRPNGLLALPVPHKGGDLRRLRPFVNVANDQDFTLVVAWLLGAVRPAMESGGAYAVLNVTGEQGSAKSTVARILRHVIDPVDAPLRAAPREERDLMIAALNGHVVSFDNVSKLPDSMSDVLCRLASGTALSTRQLYSDDEEAILKAHRPIILNGITEVVTRGDLLDRAISINLPTIPDERRQLEGCVWEGFRREHPYILGALLDAVSTALSREGTVTLERPPRLADFATWVVCAEPACPWPAGAFLEAYRGSQEAAIESSLEGNPISDVVRRLPPAWEGTSGDILKKMTESCVDEAAKRQPGWPKTARGLSGELRRLAAPLRKVGVDIHFPDGKSHSKGRILTIFRTSAETSATEQKASATVLPLDAQRDGRDGRPRTTVPAESCENRPFSDDRDGRDGRDGQNPATSSLSSGAPTEDGVDF